jgi:hypothetical protein
MIGNNNVYAEGCGFLNYEGGTVGCWTAFYVLSRYRADSIETLLCYSRVDVVTVSCQEG